MRIFVFRDVYRNTEYVKQCVYVIVIKDNQELSIITDKLSVIIDNS